MNGVLDVPVVTLGGESRNFGSFLGKLTLVVNVASKCGFTPQYAGLEALYERFKDRGLMILGFPCDQFGHQEPGDAQEIESFCTLNYHVAFPLFAKIEVNGRNTHPLYRELKAAAPGILGSKSVKWNFTKFLLDSQGKVLGRYAPTTTPEKLIAEISALLD